MPLSTPSTASDKPKSSVELAGKPRGCGWLAPHGAFDQEDQIFIRQRDADMKQAEKSKLDAEKSMYLQAKANQTRKVGRSQNDLKFGRDQVQKPAKARSIPKGVVRKPPRAAPESSAVQASETNLNGPSPTKKPRLSPASSPIVTAAPAEAAPAETNESKQPAESSIKEQEPAASSVFSGLGDYGSDSE